jgi:hypothetical protein
MDKNQFLINLSMSPKTDFGKQDFDAQTVPQKVFTAIWELEAEVNNGGFSQYFTNSSAESMPFVVQVLESIGAPITADICRRAINSAFPKGLPATPDVIAEEVSELSDEANEKLGASDSEFFAYPHDLTILLFQYVTAHPEEFGPDS